MSDNPVNPDSVRTLRIGTACSLYHSWATERLLTGARERLAVLGGLPDSLVVEHAPGSWELPAVVGAMARTESFDALVALGVVIRGETDHFDFLIAGVAQGLMQVTTQFEIPVGLGVLTCDTVEQVEARCGGTMGNKGAEALEGAVRTALSLRRIKTISSVRESCP